jgi:hypothetical protein
MSQPTNETFIPFVINGQTFDQEHIMGVVDDAVALVKKISENTQSIYEEDPESEKYRIYILAMSSLAHSTMRDNLLKVNEALFPAPNSPEEAENREMEVARYQEFLDLFNEALTQITPKVVSDD